MAVANKQQVIRLLKAHQQELLRWGVHRCGLFGSFVRDEAGKDSDVDLLVEFEPQQKNFDTFMGLCFFLEEIFEREVDLVTTESLSPYIGPHILKEVEYVPLSA